MLIRFVCCLALFGFVSQVAAADATPAAPAAPHASGTPMEFDSFIVVLLPAA